MPKDVLSYLEQQRDNMVDLLSDWVNYDSPSRDKALVDRLGGVIRETAQQMGAEVEIFPQREFGDHFVMEWGKPSGADGAAEKPILLLAHIDTVWPAGEAERRPVRVEEDIFYGPGGYDMKAGLIQGLFAVRALQHLGRELPYMQFLVTTDEEIGSPSSVNVIERLAQQAKAVFVLEPTTGDGALKTARKGIALYHVNVSGRAAHAGVEPEKGISAVLEMAHQIQTLEALNDLPAGISVTVGKASGGTLSNVIPSSAEAVVDVRALTAVDLQRLHDTIVGLKPHLEGATVEVSGGINRPPMERTEAIGTLFGLAQQAAGELGFDVEESTTGGGSDGNFTAALGIPTLDGLGPVGGGAHALHEHVKINELPRRSALIARLLELV